jgi:hypothetical protein
MVIRSDPNLVYFHKTNDQMPSLVLNFIGNDPKILHTSSLKAKHIMNF